MQPATAIEKALGVLFHLHAQPTPCGVSEIGRALALPRSSAHRMLASLARHGLVEQDEGGRYRPGVALIALGLGVQGRDPVVAAARPVLEEEAREIGETMFLCALRAGRIVVLDKAEGTGFLRVAPRIGEAIPVHATAIGRLHLAFAGDSVRLGHGPLERFTPRTLVRPAAVRAAAERARRQGWAENRGEWIPGLHVVAAPVLVGERLEATLAAGAPTAHVTSETAARIAERVVSAARRVSARLEGRLR
ncbi:MAG: IclR family transcriptional regulator [Deltaproteobacteria bacterium]|nr:IclR family transcriptional regulator [Deltaproteobacteria bacterium]